MATKKNVKMNLKSKDSTKVQATSKKGKKADSGSSSSTFFTWFIVLALLGVWTSIAVVYFNLVDYQGVLGKLVAYDKDGDGDFDLEDAKILLGLHQKTVDVAFHDEDAADPVVTYDPEPSTEELNEETVDVASHDEDAAEPLETSDPEPSAEDVVEPDPVPVEDDWEAMEVDLLSTDALPEDLAEALVDESLFEQEPRDEQEQETAEPPEVFEEDPEVVEEEPPAVESAAEEEPPAGEMPAAELEESAEDMEEPAVDYVADEEVALEDHLEMDDGVMETTNDEEEAAGQVVEDEDQGVEEVPYEEHVEDPALSYDPTEEEADPFEMEEQASPVEDHQALPSEDTEDGLYDSMEEPTEEEDEVATFEEEEEEVYAEVEEIADVAHENDADADVTDGDTNPPSYEPVVEHTLAEDDAKAAEERLAAPKEQEAEEVPDSPLEEAEETEGRSEQ
ncbi:aspartyl/asparaginyl beta-hydroxylase isoform X2 [Dunckerocampus dactyliophorus]|uniref:aspartyl/asparaginyl beta-hydroxylase isoform X2 n=1 Tax=Dunckerocampus dactyliophorus TaxID=161453 RepID=UPI00240669F6|nr:aspartyl/asparaginyl beta-hydroxylase isoform X2 [Dunckerocampus dactyliophorus]